MSNYRPSFLNILISRLSGRSFLYEFYFKDKKFLDIGCGEGEFLRNSKTNGFGIDLNERAIKKLQAEGYNTQLGSADRIDFADGSFEAVYCRNVIEHLDIEKAYKMLAEATRVLMEGGIFILASEVPTKKFWNTFGHIKPYPPEAIMKLIGRQESREEFECLENLEKIGLFYFGEYYKNKLLYLLSAMISYYLPVGRREYFLILKKK